MKFYEDTKAYYFSTNPETDQTERSDVIAQSKEYLKEYVGSTFGPEATLGANLKKFIPLVMFVAAVVLLIVFSMKKMVAGVLLTFGGVFIFLGILAAFPGPKTEQIELPHHGKLPRGLVSAMTIMIGLAVVIPTILAPKYGYAKTMVAGGAAWFVIAGIFFIIYTLIGIARYSKAFKDPVSGKCIGYIKMITGGNTNDYSYQRIFITGTPVFEYSVNGSSYKAFQEDNMRSGCLTPHVGETVELGILPEDPYAVYYHKNTAAKALTLFLSALALAAGIFLFCMMPKINDANGFQVDTAGGKVRLAKAQFDDKTIESYLKTSDYTIEYVTVKSVIQVEGVYGIVLSNGASIGIREADKDKYYEGLALYLVTPAEGKNRVDFNANDWEYVGTHVVLGMPDKTPAT